MLLVTRWLLVGFFFLHSTTVGGCSDTTDEGVVKKWEKLERNLQLLTDFLIEKVQPTLDKYFAFDNISSECRDSLRIVYTGIRKLQTWALKFLDSSGRPMANVMSGSFSAPGLYDECVGIVVGDQISELGEHGSKLSFRGQYCTFSFRPSLPPKPKVYFIHKTLPEFAEFENSDLLEEWGGYKYAQVFYFLSLRFGVCLPSTCTRKDISKIIDVVAGNTVSLKGEVKRCEVQEYNVWTKEQIVATAILGIPIAFTLIATLVTGYLNIMKMEFLTIGGRPRKTITRILDAFHVYSNVKKIMNTDNKDRTLSALHGIRFFSFTWVVLGHTYYLTDIQQLRNMIKLTQEFGEVMTQIIANATLSVDTFFFISGLLVVYVPLEKLKALNRKSLNVPFLIFHRIWRLWPPLLTTILLAFFIPWMGSGPYWHETIDPIVENCKYRWWAAVFFANSFLPADRICLMHTWYVSCDFQLYVFAVLILVILLRRPAWAFVVTITLSVIGMIITGYITRVYEFGPTILYERPDKEDGMKMASLIYFRPYTHAGPYTVGMAVGYLLHKRKRITMKPVFQLLGWMLAISCSLGILFTTSQWNRGNYPSENTILFYASLHRTAWGMCVAWLVVVCCTGNCEIIREFLSWGAFIPFSRLSYFAYLLHYLVLKHFGATNRQSIHGEHIYAVSMFFTHLTVTYLLSLIASLFFESPLLALEKIMFSTKKIPNSAKSIQELSNSTTEDRKDVHTHQALIVSRF